MALYGHALVGLGLGAATLQDPRSRPLKTLWMGGLVLLAYMSDLLECFAALSGANWPHGATASLPVSVISAAIVVAVAVIVFRERSGLALAALVAIVLSHLLLDLLDGGIPVWWPWSRAVWGPDLFELEGSWEFRRLGQECLIFGPVLALGLLVGVWRTGREDWIRWAAVAPILAMMLAVMLLSRWLAVLACGGLLLAVIMLRGRRRVGHWLVEAIPLIPVLLLGGLAAYAYQEARTAEQCWRQKHYAEGAAHYERAARLSPFGENRFQLYRRAWCYDLMGDRMRACELFREGLSAYPDCLIFPLGLARLHIRGKDSLYQPAEALRMAELLMPLSKSTPYEMEANKLLKRALIAIDEGGRDQSR